MKRVVGNGNFIGSKKEKHLAILLVTFLGCLSNQGLSGLQL